MHRRAFIFGIAVGLATGSLAALAQQPGRLPRIGVLWPISDNPELEAFRQGLRELGYVEQHNIVLEHRYARGKDEVLPALAELVGLNVDIILTYGVTAARVARQATTTIPIVNGSMSDPVAAGLAESLARPGGSVTGLTSRSPTLSAKRLELIKEVVPGLSRVAVLSTPAPTAQLGLQETVVAARSLGVSLSVHQVSGVGPRRLSPRPYADLDYGAHGHCIFLDGAQRRTSAHPALQARNDALGGPHPHGDFLLRHTRSCARGCKISHEYLQCSVGLERPPSARVLAVALRRQ